MVAFVRIVDEFSFLVFSSISKSNFLFHSIRCWHSRHGILDVPIMNKARILITVKASQPTEFFGGER